MATTFHLFPTLPTELQIQIVAHATSTFITSPTFHAQTCGQAHRITSFPPLLHVNRLFRDIVFDILKAECMKKECEDHSIHCSDHSAEQSKKSLWIIDRIFVLSDTWLEIPDFRIEYLHISEQEMKQCAQYMHYEYLRNSELQKVELRCDVNAVDWVPTSLWLEMNACYYRMEKSVGTYPDYFLKNGNPAGREGEEERVEIGWRLSVLNPEILQPSISTARRAAEALVMLIQEGAHMSAQGRNAGIFRTARWGQSDLNPTTTRAQDENDENDQSDQKGEEVEDDDGEEDEDEEDDEEEDEDEVQDANEDEVDDGPSSSPSPPPKKRKLTEVERLRIAADNINYKW